MISHKSHDIPFKYFAYFIERFLHEKGNFMDMIYGQNTNLEKTGRKQQVHSL